MQEQWMGNARVVREECKWQIMREADKKCKSGGLEMQEWLERGVRIARVAGQGCERSGVMNSSMKGEECKKGIRVVDGNISGWRGVQMADQECKRGRSEMKSGGWEMQE